MMIRTLGTSMAESFNFIWNSGNFHRLIEAEIKAKRAKGLCYRCDDKFSPGHRCKNKELQVLILQDDEG